MAQPRLEPFEPAFLVCVPCARYVPCGQPAALAGVTQRVRSLVTDGSVHDVASFIRIGGVAETGGSALQTVSYGVVAGTFLRELVKHRRVELAYVAHLVLTSPLARPVIASLHLVRLQACKEVHDVLLGENLVVAHRSTEVPRIHAVGCHVVYTAFGQHTHWYGVRVIRVSPEIWVGVADNGVVHCPVGIGLVGVFRHVVLRSGACALHCAKDIEFQSGYRLVCKHALNLEFMGVQVDIVILQLVENVERRIVACIVFVGVKHP